MAQTTKSPWLIRFKPLVQPRMRLFCFPHAGGNAAAYRPWLDYFPADIELIAVQPPGRSSRLSEPPLGSVAAIVAAVYEPLQPLLDRPFAFFGHSLGALVAFELTRALREQGAPLPTHLFPSASAAPHLPRTNNPIHHLPDAQFLAELARFNGTPAELLAHKEFLNLMLPMIRADITASETYPFKDGTPLACPITVFGGEDDPIYAHGHLSAWSLHTIHLTQTHIFSGDHFYIQAHLSAVAGLIVDALG